MSTTPRPPPLPSNGPDTLLDDETPEAVRTRNLKYERAARYGGLVCYVIAVLLAVIIPLLFLGFLSAYRVAPETAVLMAVMGFGFTAAFALIGRGLRALESWARVAVFPVAGLFLFVFPLGTILGGVVLFFVFTSDRYVFSRMYKEVIEATPGLKP